MLPGSASTCTIPITTEDLRPKIRENFATALEAMFLGQFESASLSFFEMKRTPEVTFTSGYSRSWPNYLKCAKFIFAQYQDIYHGTFSASEDKIVFRHRPIIGRKGK